MNRASLADMNSRIAAQANKKQTAGGRKGVTVGGVGELSRFRPNLLVGGPSIYAYAEDAWQDLQIGTQRFFTAGMSIPHTCCIPLMALKPVAILLPSGFVLCFKSSESGASAAVHSGFP